MKKQADWPLLSILLIALLFRFVSLAIKPPHFDEGINGWFTDQLISQGFYRYDPTNYHGPFHFYVLMIFKLLLGRNLFALRFSASAFGLASVYLIAKLDKYVGRMTSLVAALFAAVSPGMVFYSRYAIHETELLFFSLLAFHGYLRLRTQNDRTSLWQIGIGLAGMIITKETFIVHVGTFLIAIGCLHFYERFVPSVDEAEPQAPSYSKQDVISVAFTSTLLVVLFYSGFFLHWEGVVDLFRSFGAWFATGQKGNGHEKPFPYWVTTLFTRYELLSLVGLIGCVRLLWPSPRWIRFTGIYGIGILLAYSIIHYKTPWCVIELIWPFLIVTAYLLSEFAEKSRALMIATAVAVFGASVSLCAQTINLNFKHYDDDKEPYVYVQTFSDIMGITAKIMNLVKRDPSKYFAPMKVFMESNWPMPWIFGDFTKVSYFGTNTAADPDAMVVFVDARNKNVIEAKLQHPYFVQKFRLRSAQEEAYVYFDQELFKDQFPANAEVFTPRTSEPVRPGGGLRAQFFTNAEWRGQPAFERIMDRPQFFWEGNARPLPAPFGIVLSGEIFISESGVRTFSLGSDDGSDLFIDGKKVIDNLGAHPTVVKNGDIDLKSGWHKIVIHYNDFGGGMLLHLWWAKPGGTQEEIEASNFRIPEDGKKK